MRKKNRNFEENKNLYYIIGGSALLIVLFIAIVYNIFTNTNNLEVLDTEKLGQQNNIITEEVSIPMDKTVKQVEDETNTVNKIAINTSNMENINSNSANKNNNESNKTSAKTKETSNNNVKTEINKEISFIRPVDGDIIKEFSKDNLIFSETLNEWTTHNGVDLRAEKTEIVKASAAGVVKSIKNDPRYGLSVTIEHENGYKTIYANLLTSEFVVEGEKVEQGQTIGTVGNTAVFESSQEPHLHFEILKDNEYVNPSNLF